MYVWCFVFCMYIRIIVLLFFVLFLFFLFSSTLILMSGVILCNNGCNRMQPSKIKSIQTHFCKCLQCKYHIITGCSIDPWSSNHRGIQIGKVGKCCICIRRISGNLWSSNEMVTRQLTDSGRYIRL
jgi:hypothetical protein